MRDIYGRTIDYLRISVTDRCNYRCVYCMPPEGVTALAHADVLTYEEIVRLVAVASRVCGISRIRLTGGEPLVRNGIAGLVAQIAALPGIKDLAMTTNGSLFAAQAESLKRVGLKRVNISLDTLDPARYRTVTGGGSLEPVLAAVEQAVALDFQPVKINAVLTAALQRDDVEQLYQLVMRLPVVVRFIEYMPIGRQTVAPGLSVMAVRSLLTQLGGELTEAPAMTGGGPARNYRLAGAAGAVGFITPLSEHFCSKCNRLRLTADGRLKPCLLSETEIGVREILRSGADDAALATVLTEAAGRKPRGHTLTPTYHEGFHRQMSQIGG